jgi:hypothetical protein
VHSRRKTVFARGEAPGRRNRRRHWRLWNASNAFRNRSRGSKKIQTNRVISLNPNPDTDLRKNEYDSFPARRYASTPAAVTFVQTN